MNFWRRLLFDIEVMIYTRSNIKLHRKRTFTVCRFNQKNRNVEVKRTLRINPKTSMFECVEKGQERAE